jgi:hypothetical protein
MAQVVSGRNLNAESRVRARVNPCGICGGKVALGQVSLRLLWVFLSISFHRCPILIYHLGMNKRSVGGAVQRQSHPINITNMPFFFIQSSQQFTESVSR